MSIEELNAHGGKFSKTFSQQYGLWKTDFDSMAKKTALKLLLSKYAPLSIDMQTAVQTDQATFNDATNTEDINYLDNEEVKVDPDKERIMLLITSAKTLEDIEFAKEHITDETLMPALKAKELQIKKETKK